MFWNGKFATIAVRVGASSPNRIAIAEKHVYQWIMDSVRRWTKSRQGQIAIGTDHG